MWHKERNSGTTNTDSVSVVETKNNNARQGPHVSSSGQLASLTAPVRLAGEARGVGGWERGREMGWATRVEMDWMDWAEEREEIGHGNRKAAHLHFLYFN